MSVSAQSRRTSRRQRQLPPTSRPTHAPGPFTARDRITVSAVILATVITAISTGLSASDVLGVVAVGGAAAQTSSWLNKQRLFLSIPGSV